jgi:thiamine-monophosphate kinase
MNELGIIEGLRRRLPHRDPRLPLGIGDDCALYRPAENEELIFTTDMFLEGTHFQPTTDARFVGAKALARALSDIAAMAGDPRFCLVSLAAPDAAWIEAFYAGLLETASRFECEVAGGDLSRSDRALCDVVVCGTVPRGQALTRSGARNGDGIYVSGPLGRAAVRNYDDMPEPRIEFGRSLRDVATSCMDISDGLAIDLHRLCAASGVAASIDDVPLFHGATLEHALHGGDDYELLFTVPPDGRAPGIRIGTVIDGPSGSLWLLGESLPPRGYDHFA